MTLYILTKRSGKCSCSSQKWHKGEFATKAEAKRKFKGGFYGTVKQVLTEEQLIETWGKENAERFMKEAWEV